MQEKNQMSGVHFVVDEKEECFDAFVEQSPYTNLCQMSAWAKVKENWKSYRLALWKEEKLCATALLLIRSLPLGLKFAYVPRGPILDYENQELLGEFVRFIKDFAKKEKCFVLKIDAPIVKNKIYLGKEKQESKETSLLWEKVKERLEKEAFQHQGFLSDLHSTLQPRFQAVILKEDWQNNKKSNLRPYLNIAKRSAVHTREAVLEEDVQRAKALDDFCSCIESTEKRQGISLRNRAYFEKIVRVFGKKAKLFVADFSPKAFLASLKQEKENLKQRLMSEGLTNPQKIKELEEKTQNLEKKILKFENLLQGEKSDVLALASNLCLLSGPTAEMLYAGTRSEFVKLYAQYASYCYCFDSLFEQGYHFVNLGGISGDFKDGLSGFKGHFSPCIFEFLGEFDAVLSPWQWKMYQILLKMHSFLRKGLRFLKRLLR